MATVSARMFDQLQQGDGGLTDGQLLARFVAAGDEASFAALLRRHGPMVLGVCRRILRHSHDAEDAFQATFLVLARKANSVVRRESVGCWLHGVAHRTALDAGTRIARRRAREKQVKDMPHPVAGPAESVDWRPLLDLELTRLPEHYRSAIVLCDLEGRSRREAARLLGVPEGTLSSRLATARKLLAGRLARCGLSLSAVALATTLAKGTAAAQVPAALAQTTARAAAIVAAGQVAGVSAPAIVLMKGVIKAMLLKKLRLTIGLVMAAVAVGAVGFACRPGDAWGQQPNAAAQGTAAKPPSDLEGLRKENELLKFNLQVVLEKANNQEKELKQLRSQASLGNNTFNSNALATVLSNDNLSTDALIGKVEYNVPLIVHSIKTGGVAGITNQSTDQPMGPVPAVATDQVDAAVKALREAKDKEAQRKAAEDLAKALQKIQQQIK